MQRRDIVRDRVQKGVYTLALVLWLGATAGLACQAQKTEASGAPGSDPPAAAPEEPREPPPASGEDTPAPAEEKAAEADKPFELTVEAPAEGSINQKLKARVKMVPRRGYKVNLDYPLKLELQAPEGATPGEVVLKKKQATTLTEKELLLEPSFTCARAGEHTFKGTLRFSVCTEKVCEMKNETVTFTAKVSEAGHTK